MNAIKRHPFFTAWIVLCAILLAGGLCWMKNLRQRSRHELNSLAQKTRQRDQLRLANLPPDSSAATPEKIARATGLLPPAVESIPRNPLDAFIEISGEKETLRRLAASQEVVLRADESFGFASYAHAGPQGSQLAAVHRQLGLVRLTVEKLFGARPGKLLAVQREHPGSAEHDIPPEAASDFFQLDPRLELRVAGLIEGGAVHLEFTGSTHVLRTFLNSLATAPEPLLVRSVEVEALDKSSKFSVVVESVAPVASSEMAGMAAGDPPLPVLWLMPPSFGGAGSTFELFAAQKSGQDLPRAAVEIAVTDRVELLAVKREPYRLQLVGYFGSPGEYTAAFVSPGSPETLLARVGHHFESLGLTLKTLQVQSRPGNSGDEMTPCALLWDERKQESVTLVGRERLLTDTPLAIVRLAPLPAKPREFRIGDVFQEGTAVCRLEQIQLDPAEVVIGRQSPGQTSPERRVLHPVGTQLAPPPTDLAVADRPK